MAITDGNKAKMQGIEWEYFKAYKWKGNSKIGKSKDKNITHS